MLGTQQLLSMQTQRFRENKAQKLEKLKKQHSKRVELGESSSEFSFEKELSEKKLEIIETSAGELVKQAIKPKLIKTTEPALLTNLVDQTKQIVTNVKGVDKRIMFKKLQSKSLSTVLTDF